MTKHSSFRRSAVVRLALFVSLLGGTPLGSHAIILYRTADTTAPAGDLVGSGWQFEGSFGSFLGTPIASHFFLSAKHIDQAGSVFTFGATNYTLVRQFADPNSDLDLWKVAEKVPIFATSTPTEFPTCSSMRCTRIRSLPVRRKSRRWQLRAAV